MKEEQITGLDFETSIGKDGSCVLEMVALSNVNYEEVYNLRDETEMKNFIASIISSGETYVVYNASFDIEIIINLLLSLGYEFKNQAHGRVDQTIELLSGQRIYKLTVHTLINNKIISSEFIDLANLIVGENLKEIAKTYTDEEKGDYTTSKNDADVFRDYNLKDARITRKAYLNICRELGGYYITIGSASFDLMLETNFPNKPHRDQVREFRKIYGKLSVEDDKEIRKFYCGGLGWCSVENRWEGKINSWDKKSAYPYECVCGKPLPTWKDHKEVSGYAEPTKEYPFAFITLALSGEVKKNHCPVLPSRTPFGDSNVYIYDLDTINIIQIYGEKSEFDWFMENTKIEKIMFVKTILMRSATKNPLEKYMLKYYDIKEHSTGVKRDVAKRLINSLTGKLGSNPIKYDIAYKLEDGVLKKDSEEETLSSTYATQVVSVITSRVRCELYRIDKELRNKCEFRLYATDSCKHSTETETIEQKEGIGQWNEEYHDIGFIYVGLKTYMFDPYNEEGQKNVVCAGISRDMKQEITPDQFYAGSEVPSKLSGRTKGGRIIVEGAKKIATTINKPRTRKELERRLKNAKA